MELNIVICPHCRSEIIIQEVNCQIFRHGIYKSSGDQINPHASKEECDELFIKELIYGCGKPFRIDFVDEKWIASICDYI
jgi:hypothetical protein